MALTDTIGHPLEIFASKSSSEAKSAEFKTEHPGAISFTTDGKIVFGGKEWGGDKASDIDLETLSVSPNSLSPELKNLLNLNGATHISLSGFLQHLGTFLNDSLGTIYAGAIECPQFSDKAGFNGGYNSGSLSSVLDWLANDPGKAYYYFDSSISPKLSMVISNSSYKYNVGNMWLGSVIEAMSEVIIDIKNSIN